MPTIPRENGMYIKTGTSTTTSLSQTKPKRLEVPYGEYTHDKTMRNFPYGYSVDGCNRAIRPV